MTTILTRFETDTLSHYLQELTLAQVDATAELRSLLYSDSKQTINARLVAAIAILKKVENRLIACTDVVDALEALPQYISHCPQTTLHATSLLDELLLMEWDYANVQELSKVVQSIIRALRTLEICLEKDRGSLTAMVAQKEIPFLFKRMFALLPETQGAPVTIEVVRRKVLEKNELFSSINLYSKHLNQVHRIKYETDVQPLAQITLSEIPEELHLRVINGKICVYTASKLSTMKPVPGYA